MEKCYACDGDIFVSLDELRAKYDYIKIVGYEKRHINGEYKGVIILENGEEIMDEDSDKYIFVSEIFCEGKDFIRPSKDIGVMVR